MNSLNIFQIMSIISFALSSYLTLDKIFQARTRLSVDVYAAYSVYDMIYIKIVVANQSSEPAMLINLNLSASGDHQVWSATPFEKLILTNKVGSSLRSKALPINIPPKTASSFYLAFEVGANNIDKIMKSNGCLKFNLNNSYFDKNINFTNIDSRIEKLARELD